MSVKTQASGDLQEEKLKNLNREGWKLNGSDQN